MAHSTKTVLLGAVASFFLTLAALSLSSGARAAEEGKIRLGGDYERLSVRDFHGCERNCERDPRCRSWTFIKPRVEGGRGQCRLKHVVGPAFANRCCVSGVKERRQSGEAAEGKCAAFASKAIDDNETNLAERCGLRGQLWHANYNRHYRRCLRLGRRARGDEQDARSTALKTCTDVAGQSRNLRCDHYARLSAEQFKTNSANGCGFRGDLWRGNRRRLAKWCENARKSASDDRIAKRERRLGRCLSRGGGQVDEACQSVARRFVTLNDRQIRGRCGFSNTFWHSDERRHYRWCRDNQGRSSATIAKLEQRLKVCEFARKKFKFLRRF